MPVLDLNIIPTYNKRTIGIGDNSSYERTPISPTIEITVPGYDKVTLTFATNSLTIYNSNTLGMTTDAVETAILPDGIWQVKYSVNPNYENYTNVTFLKDDLLWETYYNTFLKVDINECDNPERDDIKSQLYEIRDYIIAAEANARVCNNTLAMNLYNLASKKLTKINHCHGMSNC